MPAAPWLERLPDRGIIRYGRGPFQGAGGAHGVADEALGVVEDRVTVLSPDALQRGNFLDVAGAGAGGAGLGTGWCWQPTSTNSVDRTVMIIRLRLIRAVITDTSLQAGFAQF